MQISERLAVPRKIMLRTDKAIHFPTVSSILFIEKVGRKSVIHTLPRSYTVNDTLECLLGKLDDRFVQTHRSFVVNFEWISAIVPTGETNRVYFDDYDKTAFISKHKLQEVLAAFTRGSVK